jgi:AcrR family transcriptional regulator
MDKPKRRVPNRWGEGKPLRAEIVVAASRLLSDSGRVEGLSLRAVAREAGIAAPSVYLHFKDRSELVAAVVREVYAGLAADLVRARSQAQDPEDGLRKMAYQYCDFAVENPRRYRLMFEVEQSEAPAEERAIHPMNEVRNLWTDALSACLGDRGPKSLSPGRKAALLWSGLHGAVALWTALPYSPDRRPVHDLADDLIFELLAK